MSPRKGDMDANFSHTLRGGRTSLPELLDALESHLAGAGVPLAAASAVMIAADEVLSNVINHGGAGLVEVAASTAGGRVTVEVADDGAAFDPTAAAAPDLTLGVEEREIGGLGVHLVRRLMDEVVYVREGDRNRLRFSRSYERESPSPGAGSEAF